MAARIFLWFIAIVTLLLVGGVLAYYIYGDRLVASQSMPTVEFVAPPEEEQPLYADKANWLVRPGVGADLMRWEPEDRLPHPDFADEDETASPEMPGQDESRPAAIFYVHPTTYLQRDMWNAPMQLEGDAAFRTKIFVQTQASAFIDAGQVWAPRYRQAAFGAFLSREPDALAALDVAHTDIADAFDLFLEENAGSPIVLAGHSQGALHILRLLKARGGEIADRLIAAYVVGWPLDSEIDIAATGLPVCSAVAQTGCIMSWLSFSDPANPSIFIRSWENGNGTEPTRSRDRLVCTNPITGGAETTEAALGRGTLVPQRGLESAVLAEGAVRARCDGGLLLLEGEVPELGPYALPGNNYHVYDYALFYADIVRDVSERRVHWTLSQ